MDKILITGGSGFIGQHLTKFLVQAGYEVETPSSAELDVSDIAAWDKWSGIDIRHVVHLAGKTFVPDSWRYPEQFFYVNTIGTLRALSFCQKNCIDMTYISAYVYGRPENNPISETDEVRPNNPYAESKYIGERLCKFYARNYNLNVSVLRLFNVYGKNQSRLFLIPSILDQVLKNDEIVVQNLNVKRDFVYVQDVCRAVDLSIRKTSGFHIFNVGSGCSYSVKEIINFIQEVACTQKRVRETKEVRRNEIEDVIADIRNIKKEWNWEPEISIKEGIRHCMEEQNE